MPVPLAAGEVVLLHDRAGRRYRLRLEPGAVYSLHSGSVRHDDLIGRPEGTIVATTLGGRLLALRPTFAEEVVGRRRRAQPIYPKDMGTILVNADIRPGDRVLEAGTGTGSLTILLARAVGPAGLVVSYEVRPEFMSAAQEAIAEALGEATNVRLVEADVCTARLDVDVDRVCLDLPEPWQAVAAAAAALRPGGIAFAHCPNVTQVQRYCDALREQGGFGLIETIEVLQRGWTIRGRSTRPVHRMVGHSGFLTFARRLAGGENFEAEAEGF